MREACRAGFGRAARHALVTAFEALSLPTHARPRCAVRRGRLRARRVLHHGHQPGWWYYLLESGQHVAFYSTRTLAWIGEHYGYEVTAGDEYSLFAKKALRGVRGKIVRHVLLRPTAFASIVPRSLLRRLGPYRSRTQSDHDAMRGVK
jgi:hypothetical protein